MNAPVASLPPLAPAINTYNTVEAADGPMTTSKMPTVAPAHSKKSNDIHDGAERFDPSAVTRMDELIAILNDAEYNQTWKEKLQDLFRSLAKQEPIAPSHMEFFVHSCQYILAHEKALWFDHNVVT
ncbi:hypothetical protein NX059_011455 [Plenodomus lindquistii]|nr:hypothetical protein NX059_011455 [Plenodomus lindquistii]